MENTYPDGTNYVCADCGHEWPMVGYTATDDSTSAVVKDANGTVLSDGDEVVLIKDLKVKGSSITLKMGTKVKSIRLAERRPRSGLQDGCRQLHAKGLLPEEGLTGTSHDSLSTH